MFLMAEKQDAVSSSGKDMGRDCTKANGGTEIQGKLRRLMDICVSEIDHDYV